MEDSRTGFGFVFLVVTLFGPEAPLRLTKWREKTRVPDSDREPVCAYFIEEIFPEQLLIHVKMQTLGSQPRSASPGSFALAEQASLPFNHLSFSVGHTSRSIDLLPEKRPV